YHALRYTDLIVSTVNMRSAQERSAPAASPERPSSSTPANPSRSVARGPRGAVVPASPRGRTTSRITHEGTGGKGPRARCCRGVSRVSRWNVRVKVPREGRCDLLRFEL